MNKHLCLDLDNTLLCSFFGYDQIIKLELDKPENKILYNRLRIVNIIDSLNNEENGTGNISTIMIVFRPHLFTFLNFASSYFSKISIWSAGHDRYVRAIEAILFPKKILNQGVNVPYAIYTRDDCEFLPDYTTFKELTRKNFDVTQTLSLDDRSDTFSKNPHNGILIPRYEPLPTRESILSDDNSLLLLIDWLSSDEVVNCKDIRTLDKRNIFNPKIVIKNINAEMHHENVNESMSKPNNSLQSVKIK